MTAVPSPASDTRQPSPRLPRQATTTSLPAPPLATKPKKKKLKIIVGVIVLLALVAFKDKGMFLKPHYTPGHPAPNGVMYPLANTTPFTVTTVNDQLVQTDVALQLTTVANTKELTDDEPAIESDVISVLGSLTSTELLLPSGRAAAAQEILVDVQKLLGPVDGSPQVTKVYFTGSFVIQ